MSAEPIFHNYVVTWKIEINATSPEVAAEMAREIQLDPDNIATVFEVWDEDLPYDTTVSVDLGESE